MMQVNLWPFVGDVVVVVVAVRLALLSFYSEKWWEKRADLYSTILSDLAHLRRSARHYIDEAEGDRVTKRRADEIQQHWIESSARIDQIRSIGAFVISPEAHRHLQALAQEPGQYKAGDDPYDHSCRSLDAIEKAMSAIRATADKELHPPWWRLWSTGR